MQRKRSRFVLGVLTLGLCMTAGLAISGNAVAKKAKAKNVADVTVPANAPVPDATATTNGLVASTINLGKKYKGLKVRDVNVTLQTTGTAAGTSSAASQLEARLTAPNGATTWLFGSGALSGQSVGPLTLDDESLFRLTPSTLPARDPTSLVSPYQGSAQPDCFSSHGVCELAVLNAGPVRGAWTLRVYDVSTTGPATSVLNGWRLQVVTGKPYKT